MTRILPRQYPSLDHALWESVRGLQQSVTAKMARQLAKADRGEMHRSDLWIEQGRPKYTDDGDALTNEPFVVDFISLHPAFNELVERCRLDAQGLHQEVRDHLNAYPHWEVFFEGATQEDWLSINWSAFGRVIGAAVANQGAAEKFWTLKGSDALDSLRFWGHLDESDPRVSAGDGLPIEKWNDVVEFWNQYQYDPDSEISRAIQHPPSAPFRRCINVKGEEVLMPNPLALGFRKMIYAKYGAMFGDEERSELSKEYGETILKKMLREQLVRASNSGNYATLLLFIHSACAHHLMRGNVAQQKIGLHLISMLGMRMELRGVGALNVPDAADSLRSSFTFGAVLKILRDSKVISWSYVDHAAVLAEVDRLSSLVR